MKRWRQFAWDLVWIGVIGFLMINAYCIWKDALAEPTILRNDEVVSSYRHEWYISGQKWQADHITTSLPNYMGTTGFSVDGWDSGNMQIWTVSEVTKFKQLR